MSKGFLFESLEGRRLLSTYYVAQGGNDNASGLSAAQAWASVERVNVQRIRAGDVILFQGGKTFSGGLYLSTKEGGTASQPIVFSSFGTGRATISSGDVSGLEVSENAGVAITNLNFVGGGGDDQGRGSAGIYIHAGMAGKTLSSVHIRNVDVHNYGHEGLRMIASGAGSTIDDVKIETSSFHANTWGGITITGTPQTRSSNYVIDHVRAYGNPGVAATDGFVTGSGIFIADITDSIIQRCVVNNNGTAGVAPVGIWASDCARITIQRNESYANHTSSATDGGGFDLDWDVTDSILQYNYSHDNDGAGYMLGGGSHTNVGNIIRYNISQNDGRKNGRGAIYVWGSVTNATINNNDIFMSKTQSDQAAFRAYDGNTSGKRAANVAVRDNIFYTIGGAKLIDVTSTIAALGSAGIGFSGNAFYSGGATFQIKWGATSYDTAMKWRDATAEESTHGTLTAYQGDPKLTSAGQGGTLGDADKIEQLSAYRLLATSPMINRGRPITDAVASDFFGEPALLGKVIDVGVDEVK